MPIEKKQPPVPPPKPKKELAKEEEEQSKEIVEKQEEMKEEKKEPKKPKKSLEDLYAAAREEFDLDLSPTESALKTLKEGREMQKLSVVRNLAELVEAEPAETMTKVMPAIQELLNVEPSNLDIHCEAAVVYKNCIKDQKLHLIWPELPCQLLIAILENIERQKENVTAAAWLESLVDIADCLPQKSVISMIVPVAIAQSDSGKRVQRRVISTRLIEKLANLVPREIVQRDLSPCAQMLCQDPSTAVRTSIAQKLSILAQALNNSTDCCTLLLPCIIELCKDEDPAVREAILGSLDVCFPHFSKDAKKNILLPLLRKCSEQALILRDASLPVVSRHFGSWLQCLRDILTGSDLRWWLETYIRILDFAWQQSKDEKGGGQTQNAKNIVAANNEQVMMLCRRMCAFNFPCIVSIFGEEKDIFTEKLMPILEQFCRDPDEEVRAIVASGFYEILSFRKNNGPAATKVVNTSKNVEQQQQQQPQLLNPFVELLSSGSGEVIQHLTGNLQKILPVLYKEISALGNKSNSILTKLNQMLISCNSLLRGSGSWRAHEAYLNSLAILRQLVRPKVIKQNFMPLLLQEILTARALPCRIAAAQSLLLMMRELPMAKDRQEIIEMFTVKIGQHSSCYRRRLLLDIVPSLLHNFSREFFIDKFLPSILELSSDPISNIRLQLCRTFSIIKKYLLFPKDDKSLSSLEKVIRDLLASEQNSFSRQLIQQFACELSRTETDQKECRANKTKLAEERRLWTEREEEDEADEKMEAVKKIATKKKQKPPEKVPGSPESGIFIEEDGWTAPKPQRGLMRSATTANVPEANLTGVFSASKTIAGMAIESPSSTASPSTATSRRPPISTSSFMPSWRTNRPVSAAPKLAIVRPQPQINQRSSSPMPPIVAERKGSIEKETTEMGSANSTRGNSKLPLSTTRYRSPTSKPNPGSQVQQLASKFMGNDGTESVTDSLKLKKYKPREVLGQGNTTWAKSPQRMLQQSSTTPTPPPQNPSGRKSSTSSEPPASGGPVPLQNSASSSSLNGKSGGRRPYALMKVKSTSSAVERKPAQIRCQVISMT